MSERNFLSELRDSLTMFTWDSPSQKQRVARYAVEAANDVVEEHGELRYSITEYLLAGVAREILESEWELRLTTTLERIKKELQACVRDQK